MFGVSAPFGSDDTNLFDRYDQFVPDHLPRPDRFLDGQNVLRNVEHTAFHRLTRDLFEERTVYDMTFNYNLARLNLDTRHPSAGYRYAEQVDNPGVLRAEFTPTTPFCPQTHTLTFGSFRAWNGLSDRHEYDLVRVRAAPMHHQSGPINEQLAAFEDAYRETGDLSGLPEDRGDIGSTPMARGTASTGRHRGLDDPPF